MATTTRLIPSTRPETTYGVSRLGLQLFQLSEKAFRWCHSLSFRWSLFLKDGPELGMQLESSNAEEQVTAFAPGLDAAINCNLALINVDKDLPKYNTAGLHRSKDPGAGAITPYQNCSTTVSAPIPAGGELFKNYGDK